MLTSLLLSALAAPFVTAAVPPTSCGLASDPLFTNPVSGSGNGTTPPPFVSSAWYPGWESDKHLPSDIDWDKYSLVTYAFALTTPDSAVLDLTASMPESIPEFVKEAHSHRVNASISIGGWTGSSYFSQAVTPQNRSTFAGAILDIVTKYGFDGIDFDWEYPNQNGIGCNQVSPSDSENFLAFLQELRAQPAGKNLYITAAVGVTPFAGPDGQPLTDVSGFAKVLDHIVIMNYDINGQWSERVGPNAPLDDSCSELQTGSAIKAVKAWNSSGFPAERIALGVPAYSHTFSVSPSDAVDGSGNLVLFAPFTKNPPGNSTDKCGNQEAVSDIKTFATLITEGFLNDDGTPASGITYQFDNCSQTPFVYDKSKQLMVSYDDPQSFAAKGKFIIQNNLLGFAMWETTGDHNSLLLGAITTAAGVVDSS